MIRRSESPDRTSTRRYTRPVDDAPEPTWTPAEIERTADNALRSLAQHLALWESGDESRDGTITPDAYKRALALLRRALNRLEADPDAEPHRRDPKI